MTKRKKDVAPTIPMLDHGLTAGSFVLLAVNIVMFAYDGDLTVLWEFVFSLVATFVVVNVCRVVFQQVGLRLSTKDSLKKPTNLRKFGEQSWQLAIHVLMTAYEAYLLQEVAWRWWYDADTHWSEPWQLKGELCPVSVRRLYLGQFGIYFALAYMHRFVDARHNDYFVMFSHHVATLLLVTLSYWNGWMPIGVVVLFIHDLSDIVPDVLKMVNYLGWDSKCGIPIAEAMFVMNLVTWAIFRLWIFPSFAIKSTFVAYPYPVPFFSMGCACRALLIVLFCMHIYWYYLFWRILIKLIQPGVSGHDAGREYEGGSDDDSEEESNGAANGSSKKKE